MVQSSRKPARFNRPARYSLRARLLLTLTAALLPILALSALQSFNDAKNNKELRRQELVVLTDTAVDRVEKSINSAELMLDLFAEDIAAGECEKIHEQIGQYVPAASNVMHFNADAISTCTVMGTTGLQMSNLGWNDALKDGQDILRTSTFFGRNSQAWIFAVFKRMENEAGEYIGSNSISLRAAELVTPLRGNLQLDDLEVAIAGPEGRVFGSARFETLPEKWTARVDEANAAQLFTYKGAETLDVVISKLGTEQLYSVMSRPAPPLFSTSALRPATSFGIPLLAFSTTLLAAWLAIDGLVLKWLRRIGRFASIYGEGNYQPHDRATVANAPTEISNLAVALDKMADQVARREAELKEAVTVRDAAVKEIHHRVKNNLQIVSSFLNLEARAAGSEETKRVIANAKNRISALSIVHQTLYQHERLDSVEMQPFIDGLLKHLEDALGMEDANVRLQWNIQNVVRDSDDAIPVALLLLELITNAMKHAFGPEGGTITVSLSEKPEGLLMEVSDDGHGDTEASAAKDGNMSSGLGSKLIRAFTRQLGGKADISAVPGQGYTFSLIIPD